MEPSELRALLEEMSPREQLFAGAFGEAYETMKRYISGEISEDWMAAYVDTIVQEVSRHTGVQVDHLLWLVAFLAAGPTTFGPVPAEDELASPGSPPAPADAAATPTTAASPADHIGTSVAPEDPWGDEANERSYVLDDGDLG